MRWESVKEREIEGGKERGREVVRMIANKAGLGSWDIKCNIE